LKFAKINDIISWSQGVPFDECQIHYLSHDQNMHAN